MQSSRKQLSQIQNSKSGSPEPSNPVFACPTRRDGAEGLIAQSVTTPMCQERQRRSYHKCWSCARRNDSSAASRPPTLKLAGRSQPVDAAAG